MRAPKLRADEVAFEMGRQHAGRPRRPGFSRKAYVAQHPSEFVRRARRGGWTEGGDAVPRQAGRHPRHWVALVERVEPIDAVDVHVNETWDDVVTVEGEERRL